MANSTTGLTRIVPRYVQRRVRHSLVYLVLFAALLAVAVGVYRGGIHLAQLEAERITIGELPWALTLSLLRVLTAYAGSLVFSFVFGLLAARSATGERLIIPALDILQSVPIVGFFPAAISFFISVSNGHRLGVEAAATFLIFTSQVWNMTFAVYEATKTIPQDCLDAVSCYGVRGSQRFWKLFAPACVPRLVYNSILSWSNGWYFLVACEIIAVGNIRYHLPGIGSFLARAAETDQIRLVIWGLASLTLLILAFDFLVWRPASAWSERFRYDFTSTQPEPRAQPLVQLHLARHVHPLRKPVLKMLRMLTMPLAWILREILLPLFWDLPGAILVAFSRELRARVARPALGHWRRLTERIRWAHLAILWMIGAIVGIWAGRALVLWFRPPWPELARQIPSALFASTARLVLAMVISLAWILPLVLYTWNKPRLRQALTTIAQLGASLPAIALFPLLILLVVRRFGGGMEFASILLLLTGMQWYLLFNGLGGAATIPGDLADAARSMGLSRRLTWRRLVLPAIRPALITGAITAWGGGWNALVVSEYVRHREDVLQVNGIGALLNHAVYQLGDSRAITLCIAAMVAWTFVINSLIWRPLYASAAERYRFDA
jgi:NitT/TauT family transport system permease protein